MARECLQSLGRCARALLFPTSTLFVGGLSCESPFEAMNRVTFTVWLRVHLHEPTNPSSWPSSPHTRRMRPWAGIDHSCGRESNKVIALRQEDKYAPQWQSGKYVLHNGKVVNIRRPLSPRVQWGVRPPNVVGGAEPRRHEIRGLY